MRKVNVDEIEEEHWGTPTSGSGGFGKGLSEALGRDPASLNIGERHPFDVEIQRIAPGDKPYAYHSHSAQWEFYYVIAGSGSVRDEGGSTKIVTGDAFLFQPGQAHEFTNDGTNDLVVICVADNPIGESVYLPDRDTWFVRSPERTQVVREKT